MQNKVINYLSYNFRKTSLARFFLRRKRRDGKKTNSSSFFFKNIYQKIFLFKKGRKPVLAGVFLIAVLLIAGTFFYYSKYNKITVSPYLEEDLREVGAIIDRSKLNLALIFIRNDQDNGYVYIDSAFFLQTDLKNDDLNAFYVPNYYNIVLGGDVVNLGTSLTHLKLKDAAGTGALWHATENLLGASIDRYLIVDKKKLESWPCSKGLNSDDDKLLFLRDFTGECFGRIDLLKMFMSPEIYTDSFKTNLSKDDLINIFRNFNSFEPELISLDDPEIVNLLDPDVIKAGVTSNSRFIDQTVQAYAKDLNIVSEQAEIEVYNGSGQSGYANLKRRQLSNSGINVIKYGNYFEDIEGNLLYVANPENLERYKNTISLININLRGNLRVIADEYPNNYTGDMVLVLGK